MFPLHFSKFNHKNEIFLSEQFDISSIYLTLIFNYLFINSFNHHLLSDDYG